MNASFITSMPDLADTQHGQRANKGTASFDLPTKLEMNAVDVLLVWVAKFACYSQSIVLIVNSYCASRKRITKELIRLCLCCPHATKSDFLVSRPNITNY